MPGFFRKRAPLVPAVTSKERPVAPEPKPAAPRPPAPPNPANNVPVKPLVVCFVLGLLFFIAAQVFILRWFRDSGSRAETFPFDEFALSDKLSSSGNPFNPSALSSRDLAERNAAAERFVKIFFTTDGRKLQPQIIRLSQPLGVHEKLEFVLERLFDGPATDAFQSAVPSGTRLRAVYIVEDTAVVDLEGNFLSQPLGGPLAELLCVYAVVNTITENIKSIRNVRILSQGKQTSILWDQIDLSQAFAGNIALIRY